MGALYLDITTDKSGAVARVDFLNKVPDYMQEEVRSKIMGKYFRRPEPYLSTPRGLRVLRYQVMLEVWPFLLLTWAAKELVLGNRPDRADDGEASKLD
jgi:hypothetical protein